jgi:hypothetical protein
MNIFPLLTEVFQVHFFVRSLEDSHVKLHIDVSNCEAS